MRTFQKPDWRAVGGDLRGTAWKWWRANERAIVGAGEDEMREIANALRAGNTKRAQMAILSRLDPSDPDDWAVWVAYRDGTTKRLRAAAARRHRMLLALEQLGKATARTIGRVVGAFLGVPLP